MRYRTVQEIDTPSRLPISNAQTNEGSPTRLLSVGFKASQQIRYQLQPHYPHASSAPILCGLSPRNSPLDPSANRQESASPSPCHLYAPGLQKSRDLP